MAAKWIKTPFPGVRYREHSSRRFNGRADRYFTIRYNINGTLKEEGLGWASEGWNAQKANKIRNDLREGHKTGDGPATLSEKRQLTKEQAEALKAKKEQMQKDKITFAEFFERTYSPQSQSNKSSQSWRREKDLFKLWINPCIGNLPFKEVTPTHLEDIKTAMAEGNRSPRTMRYALAVIRQVFNIANYLNIYEGPSPIRRVRMPQADNRRLRFLSLDEATDLLSEVRKRSEQLYEICLISLRTGARADEVFSLKWRDIDLDKGTMILWDTKNTKTRIAYMTEDVKKLFSDKEKTNPQGFVFHARKGIKIISVSKAFDRAVTAVGLNEGVTDRRQKVVFHTLRHTYASWLVEKGEDLYIVKTLMGHSELKMTERYSHLSNGTLQNAVRKLDDYRIETPNPKEKPEETE